MNEIPSFEEALEQFRTFLREGGHPDKVFWVFREDIWQRSPEEVLIRYPPISKNEILARKVFGEGRARGLVEIKAMASIESEIAATVWFPKYSEEKVQGWNRGMKLAISDPLVEARAVSKYLWMSLKFLPRFRHYQRAAIFIGKRDWAAAEQALEADAIEC
jgi:hypothetical protein